MLYFVGTPIGNLKDISLRAIDVLESVDEIACEDTRHSLGLLNAYDIKKPLFSYHKFNEKEAGEKIIAKLKDGKNIAVISDAGMPGVSDPGNELVKMLIDNDLEYTVIPGASAFVSALVLSGLDNSKFCFLGFLPEKNKDRLEFLEKYKGFDGTLIFYSAPHDVKRDVVTLFDAFGDRKAVAVKEITKIHEKAIRFNLKDGLDMELKGEFVILVEGKEEENELLSLSEEEHLKYYLDLGFDKKEALKKVAKERGVSKSALYKYTIND